MPGAASITLTEADYLRILIHGGTAYALLRTALETQLFEHLEKAGGLDLDGVAEALEVDRQPARILLLGLASLRLIDRRGDRYTNTDLVRYKLLRASPRYLGPLIDIQGDIINPGLVHLTEAMRQHTNVGLRELSGPGTTLYQRLTAHPDLQRVFYANMGDASRKSFAQILDRFDFTGVRHAVDIGGGDGSNAFELARRYPDITVTVFDQPTVTGLAADRAPTARLAGRVRFQPGDLFADPLPEGADTILYFHIFEIWSQARNTELLRKCRDALPEGGRCLVYSFVSADDGTGPLTAGLVSPYFLALASGEGMTYSPADMERAVRDAGFRRVERYDNLGFSHALIVGQV